MGAKVLSRWALWLVVLLCALTAGPSWAQGASQPVPTLSGHVIDQTNTLSPADAQVLEAKLSAFERERGTQLVVLVVPSTQPEDIATYAQRVGDTWKIGRRGVGDGLLLVVARQDRRVRIEVAKALEGAVPDLAASQIIERAIKPAFKAGEYALGINQGVDQLIARIQGENLPLPEATPPPDAGFDLNQLVVLGLVVVPVVFGVISAVLGRKGAAAVTGLLSGGLVWWITTSVLLAVGAWLLSSVLSLAMGGGGTRRGPGAWGGGWGGGLGGGGWGSGSGGGGGFSSGGGGDFGGGGASGNW